MTPEFITLTCGRDVAVSEEGKLYIKYTYYIINSFYNFLFQPNYTLLMIYPIKYA